MRRRRAALTLVELVVVLAIASIIALVIGSAVVTSTLVNRETYVENEVVSVASGAADELARVLSQADRFVSATTLSALGDQLRFQARWSTADGQPEFGICLPDTLATRIVDGVGELRWVADGPGLNESGQVDLNGDGDMTDNGVNAVGLGRLEVLYFNAAGTELEQYRTTIGGGNVRFVRRPCDVNPPATVAAPIFLFSRPPAPEFPVAASNPEGLRMTEIVRTEAESPSDPAVQLNLRVVHDPIPGPGGARELHLFNVRRVVARR